MAYRRGIMTVCYFCSSDLDGIEKTVRSDTCSSCGGDLKICYNCLYYDDSAYNECREERAEPVMDKEKANFCDYFRLGINTRTKDAGKRESEKESARRKIEDLFQKK